MAKIPLLNQLLMKIDPFSATLPSPLLAPSGGFLSSSKGVGVVTMQRGGLKAIKPRGNSVLEAQLSQEVWFHGPISRKEAEDLLKHVSFSFNLLLGHSNLFINIFSVLRTEIFWFVNRKARRVNTFLPACKVVITNICFWSTPKEL